MVIKRNQLTLKLKLRGKSHNCVAENYTYTQYLSQNVGNYMMVYILLGLPIEVFSGECVILSSLIFFLFLFLFFFLPS